jgi:hypothetical protein
MPLLPVVRSTSLSRWVTRSRCGADQLSLLCWDLLDAEPAEVIDRVVSATPDHESWKLAELGRLYAFSGRRDDAARVMERALRSPHQREIAEQAASSVFPKRWGVTLRDAGADVHQLLAAAEGELRERDLDRARECLRLGIEAFRGTRSPGSTPNVVVALGEHVTGGVVVQRLVRGALAVGADRTAEELLTLTDTPGLPVSMMKGVVAADIAARAKGEYRERAARTVDAALRSPPFGSSNHVAARAVDAALAAGAGDVARGFAFSLESAHGASLEAPGGHPMFRAAYAGALATIFYRVGAADRGNHWLAVTLEEDARMRRKRVRSGPQTTVGHALARALVAARRYDEARKVATRKDLIDYELSGLVTAAARDPDGEDVIAWASALDEPHRTKMLAAVLSSAQSDALPWVQLWGCLDSALLPAEQRPPERVDGPVSLHESPLSVPASTASEPSFASQRPRPTVDQAIEALGGDAISPIDLD